MWNRVPSLAARGRHAPIFFFARPFKRLESSSLLGPPPIIQERQENTNVSLRIT